MKLSGLSKGIGFSYTKQCVYSNFVSAIKSFNILIKNKENQIYKQKI